MSWDAKDAALLKKLWAAGQSAAQIARRLGCSRNAVCGRLTRLGLKRAHKPPTAKPKIRPVPKRTPALLAAYAHPVAKKVPRQLVIADGAPAAEGQTRVAGDLDGRNQGRRRAGVRRLHRELHAQIREGGRLPGQGSGHATGVLD